MTVTDSTAYRPPAPDAILRGAWFSPWGHTRDLLAHYAGHSLRDPFDWPFDPAPRQTAGELQHGASCPHPAEHSGGIAIRYPRALRPSNVALSWYPLRGRRAVHGHGNVFENARRPGVWQACTSTLLTWTKSWCRGRRIENGEDHDLRCQTRARAHFASQILC